MLFNRNFFWLIFGLISFFLINGCGDLDLEMQDTRSVVLKMNFNQRYSSRNYQVTPAEVSSHKTHLIVALPSWEQLSSDYMNYYNSFFAVELMNPSDNKVGLEIPLTGIVLREGNVEAAEKLNHIAVPCGLFPLPDCPVNVNPSQGATATSTEAPEDSWWPQGRKANVDLKWNKLEMPCGVLCAPACPEGVNQ